MTRFVAGLLGWLLVCVVAAAVAMAAGVTAAAEKTAEDAKFNVVEVIVNMIAGLAPAYAPRAELQVIGAGLSRTGTVSMKKALNMLGYNIMHTDDLVAHPELLNVYERAVYSDEALDEFVKKVLNAGYDGVLDWPFAMVARRLAARHRKAKVLLTMRDSPQAWYVEMPCSPELTPPPQKKKNSGPNPKRSWHARFAGFVCGHFLG